MSRRRSRYDDNCWENRTFLELSLIVITAFAILLLIALIVLISTRKTSVDSALCITSDCINQAAVILNEIDPNENLCNDFYKFSCKKISSENYDLQASFERELIELYQTPPKEKEHISVRHIKEIFKLCMADNGSDSAVASFKKLIKELGGWPMMDGHHWAESNFDWLQATYRLRNMGYPDRMFLDLTLDFDPENYNKLIFKISLPPENYWLDNLIYLKDKNLEKNVAGSLNIKFPNFKNEISEVITLMEQLKRLNYASVNLTNYERVKVSEFHQKHSYINWMEYIKNILHPAEITENDFVLFVQPSLIDNWFYVISKTPKRILANQIILSITKKIIPRSTKQQRRRNSENISENRLKMCLKKTQNLLTPSPINVMYARKYISSQLQNQVMAIAKEIISSFEHEVRQTNWINKRTVYEITKKLHDMDVVIGAPGNYLDDELLNEFQFAEVDDKSLLNLLGIGNKAQSHKNASAFNKTRNQLNLEKWFLGDIADYDFYNEQNNILRIPITTIRSSLFHKNLPNYINYASLGTAIAYKLTNILTSFFNSTDYYPTTYLCKNENVNHAITEKINFVELFRIQLSLKVSYKACEKSMGSAQHFLGIKYTPKQIFWIKAASSFCRSNFYKSSNRKFYVNRGVMQDSNFASDFECENVVENDVSC